ncbi:endonuclease/exonuclease/phosphatase family protein [Arachnia propionica]|uniref:Endonuclease/exonuclease/phosphatase family protein n=1 Tax=Arachnia propionica TaxID=1750 RepID=A0A3P1T457_9ACTN|nr:endonuclease/exonuclease/phosphatase family protein [Arachnia propionica]RRD03935.1 endonuclease/exonuclease/phosphatase family protein [Arachnia propionica]
MRALGWILTGPSAMAVCVLLYLKLVPASQTWHELAVYVATFIPFLWLPCLTVGIGLILLLVRRWKLVGVVVLVTVLVVWVLPFVRLAAPEDAGRTAPGIVVFSLNLQFGRADVAQVAQHIDNGDADVVAFQEYTPDFETRLRDAGLLDRYPYRVGSARTDAGGTMLLSRTPLEIVGEADTIFHNFVATTTIDGVAWHIGAIHSTPPQFGATPWAQGGTEVARLAGRFSHENLLLIGDFNAITDHFPMRLLGSVGMHPSGEKWVPTWPVGRRIPSFAQIDHCLLSPSLQGRETSHMAVTGSDHKGILVTVDVIG